MKSGRRAEALAVIGGLVLYLAFLLRLGRGISFDHRDSIYVMMGAARLLGLRAGDFAVEGNRPPLGEMLFSPLLGWAYWKGGPALELRACQVVMPCVLAVLLWVCHGLYARVFPRTIAAVLLVALAANPMLIRFSPFFLFDIFAALSMMPFLWAGYLFVEEPSGKRYAALLAAYVAAIASRYQHFVLVFVPLAYALVRGRRGGSRWAAWPLVLLPPLAYPLAMLWLAAAHGLAGAGASEAVGRAHFTMWGAFFYDVAKPDPDRMLYLASLWRQLGPGLFALMLLGAGRWLADRRGEERYLACALAAPLAVLSLCIGQRGERYGIFLLPLAYAAIGRGLETATAAAPGRGRLQPLLLVAALLLVPWRETLASVRFLSDEPSLRTRMPWRLAEILEAGSPEGACIGWLGEPILFKPELDTVGRDDAYPWLSAETLQFFVRNKVVDLSGGRGSCPNGLAVKSFEAEGPPWRVGGVYRLGPTGAVREPALWDIYADRVLEADRDGP